MSPKIKVIPDSNVFIAAALNKGYCHDWLFGASEPQASYELYTSEDILKEVAEKLAVKFQFGRREVVQYLKALDRVVHKVRPIIEVDAVRDPKDNMILECAIEVNAELVITFDKDLLSLKQYENVKIAHPGMVKYWFPGQAK